MSLVDRVLLTLYTLTVAIVSLLVMAAYAGFPPSWNMAGVVSVLERWESVPVAALFLVFSLRVLFSGVKRERQGTTITHQSDLGDVTITLTAIKNLAQRAAHTVRGVKDAKVGVNLVNGTLVIDARVSTSLDTSAPVISSTLQETIKESVETSTGVIVKEVKVLVEDMSPVNRVRVK